MKITQVALLAAAISFATSPGYGLFSPARIPQQAPPSTAEFCNSAPFRNDLRLGQESLHLEKLDHALTFLEHAHQLCPSNYSAGRDLLIAYGKLGSLQKARSLADEMVHQNDVPELHSLLGEMYAEAGDSRGAAEEYKKAAQLDPTEDNTFDFGSSLLKFEGDSALRVFRFGVGKYPSSEKMHLGLASALYGQGLIDEAASEAFKASELKPTDPEPMDVLGQMDHLPASMLPVVIERLDSLRTLYPGNARLTYYYAMALSGRWTDQPPAHPSQVLDLLKTATELDPGFAEAHFQLGEFYQEQNRLPEALHAFQTAVKLAPDQESYHYRLALAYKKSGNTNAYRREMEAYQKLHANAK